MRLADFIHDNHEAILRAWEAFARTLLPAAGGMTKAALRDHAPEILTAIVRDMKTLQTAAEQVAKSRGEGPNATGEGPRGPTATGEKSKSSEETPKHVGALGQLHAVLRVENGFTLSQVVAEYRALRASVFRLWKESDTDPEGALRFNEAIDEALAEAVDRYTEKTNQYRDQVIGIVSHDLRNPLGGILLGAHALGTAEGLDDRSARIASRIESSAKRMTRIVGDLIDLTRTRLGAQIPIVRGPTDVGPICQMVIAELEGSHPNAVIRYASKGDVRGEWDGDRLAQVLSNLVGNALQHGDASLPISVTAEGEGPDVTVTIHNGGLPIPAGLLGDIFEPMVRRLQNAQNASTGLGLGLYIAKELVTAHEGTIEVTSTEAAGTTFTVRLPRHASTPKWIGALPVVASQAVPRFGAG